MNREPRSNRAQREADAAAAARHAFAKQNAKRCLLCGRRTGLRTTDAFEVFCRTCGRELGIPD